MRGYRDFAAGNSVAFGSLEYRVQFLPSLQTEILGVLNLESTAVALFTDAGIVTDVISESAGSGTVRRWGTEVEFKNRISLFGIDFVHSLGVAQPAKELFSKGDEEIFYRIKTVIPF